MKRKTTLALSFLFSILLVSTSVFAKEKIVVIDKEFNPFNRLELSGVFNVVLVAGDEEKIHIETTEDLIDDIEFYEDNGFLKVETSKRLKNKKNIKMDIYLMYKDLKKLEINSVGKTSTENPIKASYFDLKIASVGNTNLEFDVKELKCVISAVGDVHFTGTADKANIKMSAVGELRAREFLVQNLTMRNSGIGSVEVYASESIDLNNSGIGSVAYYGNPKHTNTRSSGIGSVRKK